MEIIENRVTKDNWNAAIDGINIETGGNTINLVDKENGIVISSIANALKKEGYSIDISTKYGEGIEAERILTITYAGNDYKSATEDENATIKYQFKITKDNCEVKEIARKEINQSIYGKKVNYVAEIDNTLVWRIFYDDEKYVYLISSKEDGSNTIANEQLLPHTQEEKYANGSKTINGNLKFLNKKWFDVLDNNHSTNANAKAVAYLMDQDIWEGYKDTDGRASYAIGGPTLELFANSYNTVAKNKNVDYRIELDCNETGYIQHTELSFLNKGNLSEITNKIYDNDSNYWLSSPSDGANIDMCFSNGYDSNINRMDVGYGFGIRPVVLIPRDSFNYEIEE